MSRGGLAAGGLAAGWRRPELTYPVLLVHDLPLPPHQAGCRASAFLLRLGLEGGLGVGIIALTRDMKEINSRPSNQVAPMSYAALLTGVGQREGGRLHSRRPHTNLSIRSFFCCCRVMASTSARARGSKQMSSAGTWEGVGQLCEEPREVTPERDRSPGGPRPSSSPSPAGPSPPIPGAASGSCMGYSPNHRSWARRPLREGRMRAEPSPATLHRLAYGLSPAGSSPATHQGPACW